MRNLYATTLSAVLSSVREVILPVFPYSMRYWNFNYSFDVGRYLPGLW